MGLTVTGGIGGIDAFLEDLAHIARLLLATSETVSEAVRETEFARLEIGGCSGLDLGAANHQLDAILANLTGPTQDALHAADDLRRLGQFVGDAARDYEKSDNDVGTRLEHALIALPGAVANSAVSFLKHGDPLVALQTLVTSEPDATNLVAAAGFALHLPALASRWVADGNPVVTDRLPDVAAVAVMAPRSTTDLMAELAERNDGDSGEISVSFLIGHGQRHVIVDIPGTKSWSPLHTPDITSIATNVRAISGAETSYEKGVLEAMAQAGVTAQDDVMLVGHSEGGMVAVAAARDSAGKFRVSHVVTAGAPVGRFVGQVPKSVRVLALENRHDVVPNLDGRANPDRTNVVTVIGGPDRGSIGANHHLEDTYEPLAKQVDASTDPSIRDFEASSAEFYDQDFMQTEKFVITREY